MARSAPYGVALWPIEQGEGVRGRSGPLVCSTSKPAIIAMEGSSGQVADRPSDAGQHRQRAASLVQRDGQVVAVGLWRSPARRVRRRVR